MKKLLASLLLLWPLLDAAPADATPSFGTVVTACGTRTYKVGNDGPITLLATGELCTSGTGGGGGGGDASAANQALQITQETAINTVLGVKTDAKSAATDATSITIMQVLKELSSLLQAPVALPANQSTNEAQINGVTPLMGNGVTGTGSQRVTIASDNTPFHIIQDSGSTTAVTQATGTNLHSVIDQINGVAPTVKAASTSAALTDTALVVIQSPNPSPPCTGIIAVNQTTSTDLKTMTNFGYICSVMLVSATAQNISLTEGTGTVCATGAGAIIGGTTASVALAANGGFSMVADRTIIKMLVSADHLCLLQSGAGNVSGIITYQDHT